MDDNAKDYLLTRKKISDLKTAKLFHQKWPMLTSYDTISGRIFDEANILFLIVGDSASQVMLSRKSTVRITVDEMISMARAAANTERLSLLISHSVATESHQNRR